MRPYQNGKAPKTPGTANGKRQHSRRGKSSSETNGVRKTLLKAKVTAVKAKRRLVNNEKEEVDNLLEQSISVRTPKTPKTRSAPKPAAEKSDSKIQQRLKKSISSIKNFDQEIKKRTTRTSAKATDDVDGKAATNGHHLDVEEAEEAVETKSGSGAGFLKRAVSKLWKAPLEGLNGVPYTDINSPPDSPSPAPRNAANAAIEKCPEPASKTDKTTSSCVIS